MLRAGRAGLAVVAKHAAQRRFDPHKAQRACLRFLIALLVACMVAMLITGIAMVSVAAEQGEEDGRRPSWPLPPFPYLPPSRMPAPCCSTPYTTRARASWACVSTPARP